jgi:hypothetical protein
MLFREVVLKRLRGGLASCGMRAQALLSPPHRHRKIALIDDPLVAKLFNYTHTLSCPAEIVAWIENAHICATA